MTVKITTQPAAEPFDLDLVKKHVEYPYDDRDDFIKEKAVIAREECEGEQNRCYITQEVEYTLDRWPSRPIIYLPRSPVQSVESIVYTDYGGAEHVYAALEKINLTLTTGVSEGNDGNVTVTLDGVDHIMAVTKGTKEEVAAEIRAASYFGWRTAGTGATVTFTSTVYGTQVCPPAYDPGTTGATGNISTIRNGVEAGLIIDTASEPARIALNYGESWPHTTLSPIAAIKIHFMAGYGDDIFAIPKRIIQAIYMLTGHYVENREAVAARGHIPQEIPFGVRRLLGFNKMHWSPERNK